MHNEDCSDEEFTDQAFDDVKVTPAVRSLRDKLRLLFAEEDRRHQLRIEGVVSDYFDRRNPTWDGGRANSGKNYTDAFLKMAQTVLKYGCAPETYVKAQFHNKDRRPYSNMVYGKVGYANYVEYTSAKVQGDIKRQIRVRFESQKSWVAAELDTYERRWPEKGVEFAWIMILAGQNELTALFRYCIAFNGDYKSIMEQWEPAALMQYLEYPKVYDEIYGEWIPDHFKAAAEKQATMLKELL